MYITTVLSLLQRRIYNDLYLVWQQLYLKDFMVDWTQCMLIFHRFDYKSN